MTDRLLSNDFRLSGARPDDDLLLLNELAVDPAFRRQGIGSQLLRHVQASANRMG